jgi:integrase
MKQIKLPDNIDVHKGGSYRLRVTVNGRRVDKYLNPSKDNPNMTQRQTVAWLEKEKARIISELTSDYKTPLPFGDVLTMYLNNNAVRISDTTRTNYRGQAPRISAALGHIRIDKLTRIKMQEFVDTLPLGSQENNKSILVNVFNHAIELQMYNRNPAEFLEFKELAKPKEIYTREEVGRILTALTNYTNDTIGAFAVAQLRLFVEFAVQSGMRTGELLGVSWADIDTVQNTVYVHQQLICCNKKQYIQDETKNRKPRTITIPQRVIDLLSEYKILQQQERERMGWADNGMVFIHHKTGDLITKNAPRNWLESFCKKHDFRYLSPHSLRHFFATVLYKETKDVALVAEVIGDEKATVMKYYVHAEDGAERLACTTISNVIDNALKSA